MCEGEREGGREGEGEGGKGERGEREEKREELTSSNSMASNHSKNVVMFSRPSKSEKCALTQFSTITVI